MPMLALRYVTSDTVIHLVRGFTHKLWAECWWRDRVPNKDSVIESKIVKDTDAPELEVVKVIL